MIHGHTHRPGIHAHEVDGVSAERLAEAQGFKFDRHAARNELQAATFGKRRPATARLVLSPTGAMAIEVRSAGKAGHGPSSTLDW